MPKLLFTQTEINDYFCGNKGCLHVKTAREMANEIAVHADGIFPERLLCERRPNEPEEVKDYRRKVYEPLTMPKFSKILSSLQKIRRSSEWTITYDDLNQFTKIPEGENLQDYCEKHFPLDFTSITNWVFSLQLRKNLIDPNAVVFIRPLQYDILETDLLKPFPEIFDSCHQIDYHEGDYAVLMRPKQCTYLEEGNCYAGEVWYFVTREYIWIYEQTSNKKDFKLTQEYEHRIGMLPVFKLKGILIKQQDYKFLYQSRIYGCIPEFNEAVREGSDLQGSKVGHMYAERWEFTNNECVGCKGTGIRKNPLWTNDPHCNEEIDIECNKCRGTGYKVAGPFSKMVIKPTDPLSPGGANIPMPPAGYIQRDIAILDFMQKSVNAHMYEALAAINFQFLDNTPLNQSGVAKEVDKDELNNTVHSIAEDTVAAMDKLYKIISYYRYKDLYSFEEIDQMLPDIPVPQTYDLLSTQHLEEELINSRKGNLNPIILNAMEIDFAAKRFTNEEIRDMVELTLYLDPLPNIPQADKAIMLSNNGITEVSYILTCNIFTFVQRAMEENRNFVDLDKAKQKAIVMGYAEKQLLDNKASTQVKNNLVNQDQNNNPLFQNIPVN